MTESAPVDRRRPLWLDGLMFAVRVFVTVAGLVVLYFVLPLDNAAGVSIAIVLLAFTGVGVVEVWAITRSPYPGLRGIEALAVLGILLILVFASANVVISDSDASSFTEPLTRIDALYFALTVFSTVGFGDISASSQLARAAVSLQIAVNVVFVGIGLRLIVGVAQRRHDDRQSDREHTPGS